VYSSREICKCISPEGILHLTSFFIFIRERRESTLPVSTLSLFLCFLFVFLFCLFFFCFAFNFVETALFPVVYSPPSRCVSLGYESVVRNTNSIYRYDTSLSMSISVNKRMRRAFAKVIYLRWSSLASYSSLRLLASLREKGTPRPAPTPLGFRGRERPRDRASLRYRMFGIVTSFGIFFFHTCLFIALFYVAPTNACSPRTYTAHSLSLDIRSRKRCVFGHLARDGRRIPITLLPITFISFHSLYVVKFSIVL